MKSPNYYRRRAAIRVLFWGGLVAGIFYLVGHINYTESGYCWGTIAECYSPEFKGGK